MQMFHEERHPRQVSSVAHSVMSINISFDYSHA